MTLRLLAGSAVVGVALAFSACGGKEAPPAKNPAIDRAVDQHGADDRSSCDFRGRNDREVIETTGPGAFQPNIRRVFAIVGEGEETRRVLLCREVDTNLDGVKDVVRLYNDRGEATGEQADTNYNGRIDTWISFSRGRVSKVQVDTNGDGKPDQARFYVDGKLSRLQRDTNFNGKMDVWEIYEGGRLQRMGVDLDHDGIVDRWDRDEELARAEALKEREDLEREEAEAADAGAGDAATDAYVSPRNR
ncbi:MAG: hypothetical protein KF718_11295 [Polyangiaceae bacterium]|nr:hypothetical protein [Polyangiaceae bacterium]